MSTKVTPEADTGRNYTLAEATRPTDPLAIIAQAIEAGKTDAATIEKLVALVERVEDRRAAVAFAQAMQACQAELRPVVKDAQNKQTNSRYATLEAVNRAALPVISRHGFSLSFSTDDARADGEVRIVCDVRHLAGHCEQKFLDLPRDGIGAKGNPIGAMNPVQAVGSTFSYGRRYLVVLIFNLTITNEDDDGNAAGDGVINGKQIEAINRLLEACRDANRPVNMALFLPYAINCKSPAEGEEPLSLAMIPSSRFTLAVEWLGKRLSAKPNESQAKTGGQK